MTNGLAHHVTVEESINIQWVKEVVVIEKGGKFKEGRDCTVPLTSSVTCLNKIELNGSMDGWFAILRPFQQYFSHIRAMGG